MASGIARNHGRPSLLVFGCWLAACGAGQQPVLVEDVGPDTARGKDTAADHVAVSEGRAHEQPRGVQDAFELADGASEGGRGDCGLELSCENVSIPDGADSDVPPCGSSKDCPGELVCDESSGNCVECVGDNDCPPGSGCWLDQECHPETSCDSDKDCKVLGQVCDAVNGTCVECLKTAHCKPEQFCQDTVCVEDLCVPGESSCEGVLIVTCGEDGSGFLVAAECLAGQYCENAACHQQQCSPYAPLCVGDLATTCDELGSGPMPGGTDCKATLSACVEGQCVTCLPQCEDKECGSDGCGGDCGPCEGGGKCQDGECLPPGVECDDGNDAPWDGCSGGKIVGFQVNTYDKSGQFGARVSGLTGGKFVIVWTSEGQDGDGGGVFGRCFNAEGIAEDAEFQVNAWSQGHQSQPDVVQLASGFVVVWDSGWQQISGTQDGSERGVFGRRFDAGCASVAGEFQVNTWTPDDQARPALALLADGSFAAAWMSDAQDGDAVGVYAQIFTTAGAKSGPEIPVNLTTIMSQESPDAAGMADGSLLVLWQSPFLDGDGYGIAARLFGPGGKALSDEIIVNEWNPDSQQHVAVAALADGQVAAVWMSQQQDGAGGGIFGRLLDAEGTAISAEFQVNTYTAGDQTIPGVASLDTGGFVVVWSSPATMGSSGYWVEGQRFAADAQKLGSELQVDTLGGVLPKGPNVSGLDDGSFVVVWHNDTMQGTEREVFAQRFSADGTKKYH